VYFTDNKVKKLACFQIQPGVHRRRFWGMAYF